jgi:N-acetyl-anhydromuramyl-L-alanine amidase AmpD
MVAASGCRWETATAPPPAWSGVSSAQLSATPAPTQNRHSSNLFHLSSLANVLAPVVEPRAWKYIVVHHSATDAGSVESIDRAHRERKDASGKAWLGVGYHFVIGNGRGMADGLVEPTFRWREQLQGAHAGSRLYNEEGIGICVIGDFSDSQPTPRQTAAARQLISQLRQRYQISADRVLKHSDLQASECPGDRFPWEAIVPGDPLTLKEHERL